MANNMKHVEVKFFTKSSRHSVPDTPFSIPVTVETKDLSSLINGLLSGNAEEIESIEFDFLINGQFLRVSLEKHFEQNEISTEDVIELEYIERHPAPKPGDSLHHDDWVSSVRGCDKYILTGCYDNTLRLWSTEGKALQTVSGHSLPVRCVSWIQSVGNCRSFMSGSQDQTILLWEWDTDKNEVDCIHACRGHAGSVECVAVEKSGQRFCSGGWDNMLKLWSAVIDREEADDINEDNPKKKKKASNKVHSRVPVLTLSGHTGCLSAVAWLDDHEVCTAAWDHTIRLWDLETAEQTSSMQGNKAFLSLSYSPLNRLLITGSTDRHIRLWDPRTSDGALVRCTYTSHKGFVSSVAWSHTNEHQFLSGSYDNMVKLWDKRSPKAPLYNLVGHDKKVLAVDWSVPSLLMSGGEDNQLKIFQYEDYGTKE